MSEDQAAPVTVATHAPRTKYNSVGLDGEESMSHPTLDDRVAALEQEVARLSKLHPGDPAAPPKYWRSTLGMFANDPVMKEIIAEGRKIREHDREQDRG